MHSACRVRETTWQTSQDCCESGVSKNTSQSSKVREIFINYSYSNKVLETVDLQQNILTAGQIFELWFEDCHFSVTESEWQWLAVNSVVSVTSLVLSGTVQNAWDGYHRTVRHGPCITLNNLIIFGTWSPGGGGALAYNGSIGMCGP